VENLVLRQQLAVWKARQPRPRLKSVNLFHVADKQTAQLVRTSARVEGGRR